MFNPDTSEKIAGVIAALVPEPERATAIILLETLVEVTAEIATHEACKQMGWRLKALP